MAESPNPAPSPHVLFAGATMVPGWGGGEPVIADLLQRGLEELGVRVTRVGWRRSFRELLALGVLPIDLEPTRVAFYRRLIRKIRPDVVIAWFDYDCSLIFAAGRERVPVISSVHIYWPTCPIGTRYIEGVGPCDSPEFTKCLRHMAHAEISPNLALPLDGLPAPLGGILYSKIKNRPSVLGRADAIVVVSDFMGQVMTRAGYRQVHVIHNGVDPTLFSPTREPSSEKVVLYPVARSRQERKGYSHFVGLAQAIKARFADTRFQVLNDPGDELIDGTPFLSRAGLARLFGSVYLTVIPGLWEEPFGLVALEAMSCGRPVVAYDAGGLSEVIEQGVSGVLVPRGDLKALIDAVSDLLEDPGQANRMGAAARLRAETRFPYQIMAHKYLDLVRRVMMEHPAQNQGETTV